MSKQFITVLSMLVCVAGINLSCKHKTEEETPSSSEVTDTVYTGTEDTGKQVTGVLLDATMNTAVLVTPGRDTLSFATGGSAIIAPKGGMMIGDTLFVTYEGNLEDRSSFPIAVAKKVIVHSGIHETPY